MYFTTSNIIGKSRGFIPVGLFTEIIDNPEVGLYQLKVLTKFIENSKDKYSIQDILGTYLEKLILLGFKLGDKHTKESDGDLRRQKKHVSNSLENMSIEDVDYILDAFRANSYTQWLSCAKSQYKLGIWRDLLPLLDDVPEEESEDEEYDMDEGEDF